MSSLEDFTGTDSFRTRPDGDIDFERGFPQWFANSNGVGMELDMK